MAAAAAPNESQAQAASRGRRNSKGSLRGMQICARASLQPEALAAPQQQPMQQPPMQPPPPSHGRPRARHQSIISGGGGGGGRYAAARDRTNQRRALSTQLGCAGAPPSLLLGAAGGYGYGYGGGGGGGGSNADSASSSRCNSPQLLLHQPPHWLQAARQRRRSSALHVGPVAAAAGAAGHAPSQARSPLTAAEAHSAAATAQARRPNALRMLATSM